MEVKFEDLGEMDLIIDTIYKGGKKGNTSDDPLSKIFPKLGNMSGFRKVKKKRQSKENCILCFIYIYE